MSAHWNLATVFHATLAATALIFGGFNVFRPTRGDAVHKAVGRIWAVLMEVTAISGLIVVTTLDRPHLGGMDYFLMGLAVFTIVTIALGVRSARRGRIKAHAQAMVGNYIGLIIAGVFVVVIPTRDVPESFHAAPLQMTLTVGCIVAFCVALLMTVVTIARRRPVRLSP